VKFGVLKIFGSTLITRVSTVDPSHPSFLKGLHMVYDFPAFENNVRIVLLSIGPSCHLVYMHVCFPNEPGTGILDCP
jgi:hypothetical protein